MESHEIDYEDLIVKLRKFPRTLGDKNIHQVLGDESMFDNPEEASDRELYPWGQDFNTWLDQLGLTDSEKAEVKGCIRAVPVAIQELRETVGYEDTSSMSLDKVRSLVARSPFSKGIETMLSRNESRDYDIVKKVLGISNLDYPGRLEPSRD